MASAIYPDESNKDKLDAFTKRNSWAKNFVKDKNILDLGCGSGYATTIYGEQAKSILGVDREHTDFAIGHFGTGKIRFEQYDIREPLPYSEQFDVVLAFEIIEHFHYEEAQEVIKNVYRALKPGGILIGSTPKVENHTRYFPELPSGQHCVLYHREDLIKQLDMFDNLIFSNIVHWAHMWKCRKPFGNSEIDVILLSLERFQKTIECVKSIRANSLTSNIFIIENGSPLRIQEKIKDLKKYGARLIFNQENRGVGAGRRQGAMYGNAPYIVFLDNDIIVNTTFFEELKHALLKYNAAAVGAKVIKDGKVQLCGRSIVGGRIDYSRDNLEFNDPRVQTGGVCDIIHGGATMYRRNAYERVEIDNSYFIGYEDLDLMMQLRAKGYNLAYCPGAKAYHKPDFGGRYGEIRRDIKKIAPSKAYFEGKWRIKT